MTKIKNSKCKCGKSETEYLLDSEANSKRLLSAIEGLSKFTTITPQGLFDLGFEESYQEPEGGQAGFIYYFIDEYEFGVDMLSNEGGTEVEIGQIIKVTDFSLLAKFINTLKEMKGLIDDEC